MKGFACCLLLASTQVFADFASVPAHGFHWYTKESQRSNKLVLSPVSPPSPYEQLMTIRKATQNKLARALISPSFDTTLAYMQAQMRLAKNNQKFVRYWEQVLLLHPELDNTLNFPTDNSAIAIHNDATNELIEKIVKNISKHYGFILFYKGKSRLSQKFVTHLLPFVETSEIAMISVATDAEPIQGLPNPKTISLEHIQQTMDLQSRYMPALFLVNLKTQKMSPLSYGFVSLTELKERLLDVVTHYKRFSYEGLLA